MLVIAEGNRNHPGDGARSGESRPGETGVTQHSRAWIWPVGLVMLLCGSIAVCVVTAVLAASDQTFGLEPDYYQQAVDWDQAAARREASAALGWTLSASVSTPRRPAAGEAVGDRVLGVRLVDRDGNPVSADRVEVVTFHHARSRDRLSLSIGAGGVAPEAGVGAIVSAAPGAWEWSIGPARAGVWQVRVRAVRGQDLFTGVLNVETPDGGR